MQAVAYVSTNLIRDAFREAVAGTRAKAARGREPLVLLPGMLGDASLWDEVAPALTDVAHVRMARIDLDDSIAGMAATVLAAAPERFALAGHSLGAIVALEIIRQAPRRVTRLALLNASARPADDAQLKMWAGMRDREFATVVHAFAEANARDGTLERVEAMAHAVGPRGMRRQLAAQATRPDSRPALPDIVVPTLVLTGAEDRICPRPLQEELAAGYPGRAPRRRRRRRAHGRARPTGRCGRPSQDMAGGEPMTDYLKQAPWHSKAVSADVRRTVSEMLSRIDADPETEIRRYSKELDGWDPESFLVDAASIERAAEQLDEPLREHIAFAQDQVRTFAQAQRDTLTDLEVETLPGVVLGHRHIPVQTVGSYVPGGRYPMLASSFMTVVVPKVAGVERVIACAPPRAGEGIHPAMLHAMHTSGADDILALGGVQALAAMTYGIEGLPEADIIVGAGNAYVAEAKRQLFGQVGIDLLAGPTEVAIIADETADAELVALDLLGQAEHGPTSPAMLITTSRRLGEAVLAEVERQLETFPTAEVARAAWEAHGSIAVVADDDAAIELSDRIASEHLEVQVEESKLEDYRLRLRNYGSLFLGDQATVAYGDKAVGTNHVLPTLRAARYTGGLWVGKFLKTCTYQRLTAEGTRAVAPAVAAIATAEHMEGHALTATHRLDRLAAPAR